MALKQSKEPVKTVLVIVVGFLIVYGVWRLEWALTTALVIGIAGLLSGYLAEKIDFLWMKLAWVLSLIVPNILLSVIFFLFLTPIAWLSRIFGEKNPLSLRNSSPSLFKEYKKVFDQKSFERPW